MNKTRSLILRRFAAYLLDSSIIFVIYVVSQTILLLTGAQQQLGIDNHLYLYTFLTISLPFYLLLSTVEFVTDGRSPGKIITKIRVESQQKSKYLYFLRNIPKLLVWEFFHLAVGFPSLFLMFAGLGYLLLFINIVALFLSKGKKSVHDFLIGSKVSVFK